MVSNFVQADGDLLTLTDQKTLPTPAVLYNALCILTPILGVLEPGMCSTAGAPVSFLT